MKRIRPFVIVVLALALLLPGIHQVAAQDKVELSYWSMWNESEPQAKIIENWIADFQASHPNLTIKPVWNGRQNFTLVRTALSGGKTIDFMDQDAEFLVGSLMKDGNALPLNKYLDTPALDEKKPLKDVFLPGVLNMYSDQGNIYMFPYIYNVAMFWYSREILDKAGISKLPQTWEDFLAANDAIRKAGFKPIAAESDLLYYQVMYLAQIMARLKGPGFVLKAAGDKTGEMWKDPAFLQQAKYVRQLWERGDIPSEIVGYIWPQGQQTIASGQSALELVGSWLPIELAGATGPDFKWGGMPFPTFNDQKGSSKSVQALLLSFLIVKSSKHPDEAFEFLRFTMTKANQQAMADKGLVGSTHVDIKWSDKIQDAQVAAANADVTYGHVDGILAYYPEYLNNILLPAYRDMFLGKITPEDWVSKMASQTKDYWATHQ